MIRMATKNDLQTLVNFNIAIAYESEKLQLDYETVRKGVLNVLDDFHKGIYYVYEINGEVVGQLLITYEWSDWRNANWWWIQSVYTKPAHRGKGVFSALFAFIEQIVQSRNDACGIRLTVDRHNLTAQKTYKRLKMFESHYFLYELPKVKSE